MHNNITHNSSYPSVEESVGFLLSYHDNIMHCKNINIDDLRGESH